MTGDRRRFVYPLILIGVVLAVLMFLNSFGLIQLGPKFSEDEAPSLGTEKQSPSWGGAYPEYMDGTTEKWLRKVEAAVAGGQCPFYTLPTGAPSRCLLHNCRSSDKDSPENKDIGFNLHKTTGTIWADVFPFGSLSGPDSDMNFVLSYDSVQAGKEEIYGNGIPLGYGWDHSFDFPVRLKDGGPYNFGSGIFTHYYEFCEETYCHLLVDRGNSGIYTDPYPEEKEEVRLEIINNGANILVSRTDGTTYLYEPHAFVSELWNVIEIKDPRGMIDTFEYNGEGFLERVVTAHGREFGFVYSGDLSSGNLRVWKITGPDGGVTEILYDGEGNIDTITDAEGGVYEYDYEGYAYQGRTVWRMSNEVLPNGASYRVVYEDVTGLSSRTVYDSQNNVVASVSTYLGFPITPKNVILPGRLDYTDGRGQIWEIWRNFNGYLTYRISPEGKTESWIYGGYGGYFGRLTAYVNENRELIRYEWGRNGELRKFFDEDGNVDEYIYDYNVFEKSGLLQSHVRADGDSERWEYDPSTGDLLTYTDFMDNRIDYEYETWSTGLPGRVKSVRVTTRDGNNNPHLTKVEYDERGNAKRIIRAEGGMNLIARVDEHDAFGNPKKIIVERGDRDVVVQMNWDGLGRLTDSITDPNGLNLATHIEYDSYGLIDKIRNPRNIVTDLNYDHRNRMNEIVEASGELNIITGLGYDGESNVESLIDANGEVTSFEYNDQNYPKKEVDAEGYVTKYTRDNAGNILRIDRGLERGENSPVVSVSYTYDNLNRLLTETIDPDGDALTTTYEYDRGVTPGFYLPYKIVDAEGKVSYLYYDELNRVKKAVSKVNDVEYNGGDNDDAITRLFYDPLSNLVRVISPEGEETILEYDEAYRLKRVRQDPNGENLITIFALDGADNVNSVTLPNGNVVTYGYDGADRLEKIYDTISGLNDPIVSYTYSPTSEILTETDALGHSYTWTYDQIDRPISVLTPKQESYEFDWDNAGQLTDSEDPLGIVTHYVYDRIGQNTQVIRNYNGIGAAANTDTFFEYNGAGWLTRMLDNERNPTTNVFDNAGRIESVSYPDGSVVGLRLNGVGNVVWRQMPDQTVTELVYNDLHQLTRKNYPGRSESFSYDKSGRLLSANNDVGVSSFSYDNLGRIESAGQEILEHSFTSDFDYVIDTISSVTRNGPVRSVTNNFDLRGRIKDINAGNVNAVFTFDLDDNLNRISYGNGVLTEFGYDSNDRITRLTHKKGSNKFFDREYGYDDAGRRTYTLDFLENDMSSFAVHDSLDRLTEFDRGTLNSAKTAIQNPLQHQELSAEMDWGLDSRGNWESFVEDGSAEVRTHNGVNEILNVNGQALTHDDNGNLVLDPEAQQIYEYDEENRLIRVKNLNDVVLFENKYDALGRRVKTKDYVNVNVNCNNQPTEILYVFEGLSLSVTEEYAVCGNQKTLIRETIPGLGFPNALAVVNQPGNEVLYLHNDYIGSPIALTNTAGNVIEKYAYDLYGKQFTLMNGNVDNPIGFTGQRNDESVGLTHFMFRSYSPSTGRFLQRDPSGYADGVNLYEYVSGDPMGSVDSLGLDNHLISQGFGILTVRYTINNMFNPVSKGFWEVRGQLIAGTFQGLISLPREYRTLINNGIYEEALGFDMPGDITDSGLVQLGIASQQKAVDMGIAGSSYGSQAGAAIVIGEGILGMNLKEWGQFFWDLGLGGLSSRVVPSIHVSRGAARNPCPGSELKRPNRRSAHANKGAVILPHNIPNPKDLIGTPGLFGGIKLAGGSIKEAKARARKLTGMPTNPHTGRPWVAMILPEDLAKKYGAGEVLVSFDHAHAGAPHHFDITFPDDLISHINIDMRGNEIVNSLKP